MRIMPPVSSVLSYVRVGVVNIKSTAVRTFGLELIEVQRRLPAADRRVATRHVQRIVPCENQQQRLFA
jgi:hypothetical protein